MKNHVDFYSLTSFMSYPKNTQCLAVWGIIKTLLLFYFVLVYKSHLSSEMF